ncbi:hypothetical protein HVPorG_04284 [Roseomonas mucosa]|nr:hypothetical protein HVIM_04284 [Roseomonas mucosa]QDE00832.1 hypothetical protein ADP8_04284 [Roseomonas mucosa]QDJ10524.1 hypothetical protein HVPorG_04284 [Roseomonas mucosa]UZO93122.1 Hypothetical protein RMP42_04284 [Roseomonas mucosa]UZO97862.1 Hypothetical protein RMHFA_04284 [Roseomonas mucosa]
MPRRGLDGELPSPACAEGVVVRGFPDPVPLRPRPRLERVPEKAAVKPAMKHTAAQSFTNVSLDQRPSPGHPSV